HGLAGAIFAEAAHHGMAPPVIEAIATADWPTPARRPPDSRLDCTRMARVFGVRLPDWRGSLSGTVGAILAAPELRRSASLATGLPGSILACWPPVGSQSTREAEMPVASVSKITAASPTSFDAAIQEGLARASKTLRGITGLHVIEEKASVANGKIAEYRVTMELTFILEG
ncbi:MAG: dodecin domain-containing protein, partial [Acetobacteraceae bacterium]